MDSERQTWLTPSSRQGEGIQVLIVTAVEAERDAILRGLNFDNRFHVIAAGVGQAIAAAVTARVLATNHYDLVISAGIGGGFKGQAEIGSLVVASEIIAADLGVQTYHGFLSLDEMGFGSSRVEVASSLVAPLMAALRDVNIPVRTGPVLTVSTVTGTAENAEALAARVEGAAVEAMEGYGVAIAAQDCGIPVIEIRAISNAVGPRDRESWRIPEALKVLESSSSVLLEVL